MKAVFTICILAIGIISCSEYNRISIPSEQETQVVQAIGDSISKILFKTLQTKLKKEMQSAGPKSAIKVCSQEALVIADEIAASAAYPVEIKRTTFKNRNPKNAPDDVEGIALKYYEDKFTNSEKLPAVYVQKVKEAEGFYYNYYKPMRVGNICLVCHGNPEQMDPDLTGILTSIYPNDLAVGYKEGDFRGLISIKIKNLDKTQSNKY